MLRVRDCPEQVALPSVAKALTGPKPGAGPVRMAAMGALGLALGAGGVVFAVSLVQAGDDAGIRAFHLDQAAKRQASRPDQAAHPAAYLSRSAYAPSRGWSLPLFQMRPDGRIAHPPVDLNPFKPAGADAARPRPVRTDLANAAPTGGARSICVRLCDGFHAPIGFVRGPADMKAHEVLCSAMNPGLPVKVFRVAAGAATIDDAQAADGKTYKALPMAYSHEKASDAACRPAIVQAGERRVSLLRDFTLRPGDSVVLDGKVRTFAGASRWPYSPRDFNDFRRSAELSQAQRQQIDERVGISRLEAQALGLRRQMRIREASLRDDAFASDAVASDTLSLRGTLEASGRGAVRVIPLPGGPTQP